MIERSRLTGEEGISLVEMLIAIVVLGIVMGAMGQSLATSLFSVQRQEKHVHATALAAQVVEETVSLPWGLVGLCETPATTQFGGNTFTYANGDVEPLVLFDDAGEACTAASGPSVLPAETVERPVGSGVFYDVETAVTWHDDVQDDDASGNDPNTEQDVKRIHVTVSWDVRGDTVTYAAETFRAPGGTQVGLHTRVEHDAGAGYTYLHDLSTLTQTPVQLRLFAGSPQTGVMVSWETNDTDGDGDRETVTRAMVNPTSDRVTWLFTIPAGSPEFAVNNMPNAEVLFTFTATDTSGTPSVVLDRGLFLIERGAPAVAEGHHIAAVDAPSRIVIKDGAVCEFVVEATVRGALGSDPVTISWSAGPPPAGMSTVTANSTSVGNTFRATFTPLTGTFPVGSVTYTITAERPADLQTGPQAETATGQVSVVPWQEGMPC